MRIFDDLTGEEIQSPDLITGYIAYETDWIVETDGTPEGDVWERIQIYHEYTPEELARIEQTEADKERQEIIDALPDAVAELSLAVSDGAMDASDLADALAELSAVVSGIMEVINNG